MMLYAILFTPGVIMATIVYNRYSIKTGLIIGALLQALGAGFKTMIKYGYWAVYVGQSL